MKGGFKLGYFFKGAGFEDWVKSWGLGWRLIITLCALLFVAVLVYRAFFMKTQSQSQSSKLIVYPFSFSTITYVNSPQQQQKQEIKKRPWWIPILFIEGYGFSERSLEGFTRTGAGVKSGARFEF